MENTRKEKPSTFERNAQWVMIAVEMNGTRTMTSLAAVCLLVNCGIYRRDYGLPIKLGARSDDVRRILGAPNSRMIWKDDGDKVTEWYYSHGMVCVFDRDHLSEITLNVLADWEGFLPYNGPIVKGVTLSDTKDQITHKLGVPSKIENDDLESGVDISKPVVWPKETRHYWRFPEYVVKATFLLQAQDVSTEKNIRWPPGRLTVLEISR